MRAGRTMLVAEAGGPSSLIGEIAEGEILHFLPPSLPPFLSRMASKTTRVKAEALLYERRHRLLRRRKRQVVKNFEEGGRVASDGGKLAAFFDVCSAALCP